MKKPLNYFGYTFDDCKSGYNKQYLKSKKGKKDMKRCKKQNKKYKKHLQKYGFDPSETWNLDSTIAQFTLPRLKYFRDNLHGYPQDFKNIKAWKKVINKIIFALEAVADGYDKITEGPMDNQKKEFAKVKVGLELFGKYLTNLWD